MNPVKLSFHNGVCLPGAAAGSVAGRDVLNPEGPPDCHPGPDAQAD